ERIVAALRDAACNARVMSHHEQKTRDLANSALAQDGRHDWQLAAYPARLQVQTIDALCAGLARQAPIATGLGGSPRFADEPYSLYVQAAREALAAARPDDRSWSSLLAHLDNNAAHAIELLAGMLSTRDQW